MHGTRTKLIVAVTATAVLVGAVATGRHLIAGTSATSSAAATIAHSVASPSRPAHAAGAVKVPAPRIEPNSADALSGQGTSGTSDAGTATAATGAKGATPLAAVPAFATPPLVVHTASVDLRVAKGGLNMALHTIASLAGVDGGYVDNSSLSGGTARRSPVSGSIVFRVLDSDFADAISTLSGLGTVESQQIKGKDVTVQVAQNAASIIVLQDEVALLETKLGEASDIGTFLQIESQLFPVEQQLQSLQAAQAVLQNSAALATITVGMTAPGAPVVAAPAPRPNADAATVSWRYLRHNTLAVLDALAVAGGWALPVIVLLALLGFPTLAIVRRRRHAVNPA
jgi:hypothetical protein